jgi:hypothetical protein
MSQIFHRSTNIWSKFASLAAWSSRGSSGGSSSPSLVGYVTGQGVTVDQPVQFSHAHHVGSMGIDCRYCHTTVEESAFANIPPTKTCMNCHSQIWTNAPILEPVRASFRENRRSNGRACTTCRISSTSTTASTCARASAAPPATARRPHAADVPGEHAADEVVPGLPPQPGEVRPPARSGLQHGVRAPADDPGLGERLVKEYKIADVDQLTSCSTCHDE